MNQVKPSAITYTGYDYQTMYGILMLAQWLNSPDEYEKICFEADHENNETPQGIDDVVCEHNDGKRDFYQVKFTPSPNKTENALSWNWLLKKSGKTKRSRSLIKKLFDAVNSVNRENLGSVALVTNKLPDRKIESSLSGQNFDYEKLTPETKEVLQEQLGEVSKIKDFFSILEIKHSDSNYDSLNRIISLELSHHSNQDGINRLRISAKEWAMFKNLPTNDGWIYLHNVREVLSQQRPNPIPQSFTVPTDYCLPDTDFHEKLFSSIINSQEGIITVTGTPGRGKSTYLSYLCRHLEEQKYPLVRHHYFLSINDRTVDRINPWVIQNSIRSQIESNFPDVQITTKGNESIHALLELCGEHFKAQKKHFTIVIDGLDHVWRDNDGNKKPLDSLFKMLLPLPLNVVLIVGTQPVSDNLLPETLLEHCPRTKWLWLPSMSGNAIFEYINCQYQAKRIHLNCHPSYTQDTLKAAAEALAVITQGYPLHVIYSCEYLIQHNKTFSKWEIKQLPSLERDNIETYYDKLWRRLSHRQKDVLHLCCEFPFYWPRRAFAEIFHEETYREPSYYAVAHMLYDTTPGLKPFHESLIAYVKKFQEHSQRINDLAPALCAWLEHKAPINLKYMWLWVTLAKTGNSIPLRSGLSRDWVLDRLSEGYRPEALIRLLTVAESISFNELKFAEAFGQRALKTRLKDGPEFQTWDRPNLEILSMTLAPEELISEEVTSWRDHTTSQLATISIALWRRGLFEESKTATLLAVQKHRSNDKLNTYQNNNEKRKEIELIIRAGVLTEGLDLKRIFKAGYINNWEEDYIDAFIKSSYEKSNLELLLKAHKSLKGGKKKYNFEVAIIRLSLFEEIDISSWDEFTPSPSNSLYSCLYALKNSELKEVEIHDPEYFLSPLINANNLSNHELFFSCLHTRLIADGDYCWLPHRTENRRTDTSEYFDILQLLSEVVAAHIQFEGKGNISFSEAALSFPKLDLDAIGSLDSKQAAIWLKRDWISISADLHLLTQSRLIELDELNEVIQCDNYLSLWIRLWYIDLEIRLLSDEAAEKLICIEDEAQQNELVETIERSNGNIELARIAARHQLIKPMSKHVRLSWDYTIGYGYHKDTTIFDTLSAIELISAHRPDQAIHLLKQISPIAFNISRFTDGDETHHTISEMSRLLAKLSPATAASKHIQEVNQGEWYEADSTLEALLRNSNLNSTSLAKVCHTGLSENSRDIIEKKSDQGDKIAAILIESINQQFGYSTSLIKEKTKQQCSIDKKDKIDIPFDEFPPTKFEELVDELRSQGHFSTKNYWLCWYQYWINYNQEKELLTHVVPYLKNYGDKAYFNDMNVLYEPLYPLVKKYKGKRVAFEFLVSAQKVRGGWTPWNENDESKKNRLLLIAQQYTDRVDEFILRTTTDSESPIQGPANLIIPNVELVYLLIKSGRLDEATELTISMIKRLEDDTRNMPLPPPKWEWEVNKSADETWMDILIARLKWPVPSVKLWVAEQLSELLINSSANTELKLLKELASRQLESECIEILCIFLMASDSGYVPNQAIGKFVKARSILSDMIIRDIEPCTASLGVYANDVEQWLTNDENEYQFDLCQGNEVPLIYHSRLKNEEDKTGLPFLEFYKNEWIRTFEYSHNQEQSISYFLGSNRHKFTGQFYTKNSHRGRSAYLRTLRVAQVFWKMPREYAESLATLALPLEPTLFKLDTRTPKWFPQWRFGLNITEANIHLFITQTLKSIACQYPERKLGALSFPIKLNSDTWIDFSIIRCAQLQPRPAPIKYSDRSFGFSHGEKLKRTLKVFPNLKTLDTYKELRPLVGTCLPISRYGHWHLDVESRGIYMPLLDTQDNHVETVRKGERFIFKLDETELGEFKTWLMEWAPTHPEPILPNCGTLTLLNKDTLTLVSNLPSQNQMYQCDIKIILRDDEFSDFEEEKIKCLIPIKS